MTQSPSSDGPSEVLDPSPAADPGHGARVHDLVVSAYVTHHAELLSFLTRATRDPAVAEELLQATFARLTREARAGHAPPDIRAWLYRVAANLAIGSARGRATAARWFGRLGGTEDDAVGATAPEAGVLSRERAAEMEQVLDGLSAEARLALLLSGAGFAGHEIAAALDRTEPATRTLLTRARTRVRIRRDLFAGGPR